MTALFDLTGRRALITGSSRGLGLGFAQALASHGASVILNGMDEARLDTAVQSLRSQSHDAHGLAFDVSNEDAVTAAFEALDRRALNIDILINNAGIQFRKPLTELALTDWQRVIDINLTSAFLIGREAARRMIQRGQGGQIVNIRSLMSDAARATIAPYTAAKGGIKMLTRAMTAEWAAHNIQVNAIGPGYMATDMNEALINNPDFDQWVKRRAPAGRWGLPDELGGTAVYLASNASNYVNGQIIYVDGGMLAVL
jgi:gluconate 5-dehydrogenase